MLQRFRWIEKPMTARTFLAAALVMAVPRPSGAQSAEAPLIARVCARGADASIAAALRDAGAADVGAAEVLPNPSLVVQHQQTLGGPPDRESAVGITVPLGLGGRRFIRPGRGRGAARESGAGVGHGISLSLTVPITLFYHGQGEAYRAREEAGLARVGRTQAIAAARVGLMRSRGSLLDPTLERACIAAALTKGSN